MATMTWVKNLQSCLVFAVHLNYYKVCTCMTIGDFRVPRSLCIKTRLCAHPLVWKWFFILMQIKLIFSRKVEHLASFWKWGSLELGINLLRRLTRPLCRTFYENMRFCMINVKYFVLYSSQATGKMPFRRIYSFVSMEETAYFHLRF